MLVWVTRLLPGHRGVVVARRHPRPMGWELSSLGYPVSNEYAIPGGRRSDFQHGSITYRFSDGAILLS